MIDTETQLDPLDTMTQLVDTKSKTIVYVDDEEHNLRVFRSSFRRHYNVVVFESPQEAITYIKSNPVNVLVTDQRMPGLTGTQMIELLREDFPELISVIITGYSDIEAVTDAINKCNIYRFFTKPFDFNDLKSTFDGALEMEMLKEQKESLMDTVQATNSSLEEKISERTKELNDTHQRLVDSLKYAENIQKTILTDPTELGDIFDNQLIFYKPLDIVSGDFYMLRRFGSKALIGAFDCTGHGVPGAMLSMIGNAAIDNALVSNIVRPSELLSSINNKIYDQLSVVDRTNDTMDGSFLLYNKESNKLLFSGAQGEMVIFKNDELVRVRGNRMSIGYKRMDIDESFDLQTIDANGVTEIYLYSDGYRDQYNEELGQRFKTSRFHALLNRIHKKDLAEQNEILENEFSKWKGEGEQTDDIMVLAFRLPNS